jgi:hypothetical protein
MSKYSEDQLKKLAEGTFKTSPHTTHLYASSNGTFLNEQQYQARDEKAQQDFIKIDNPAHAQAKAVKAGKGGKAAEAEGEKEDGEQESDESEEGDKAKKPKGSKGK